LPFTDCCPALGTDGAVGVVAAAACEAAGEAGVASVEVRDVLPDGLGVAPAAEAVRHRLSLVPGPESLLRGVDPAHRRNIKRAVARGVDVHRAGSDGLAVFYRLHLLTRRRLGVPVQPWRFFALLGRHMLDEGLGFVLTAQAQGRPVASAVFLAWNGTLIYKFGASDPRYWECRPNNALFWRAIEAGCALGCHTLDFGRSDIGDTGLRRFKRGWGAVEEPLRYTALATAGGVRSGHMLRRGHLERVMAPVIRRSPLWVCRTLGGLLYRYAA
jgi:hypothetical protein